jgi:predicted HTH transcriptional regulator
LCYSVGHVTDENSQGKMGQRQTRYCAGAVMLALEKRNMTRILEILKLHRGHDRAITAKELTKFTGIDDRAIRQEIRKLIAQGYPIASNLTRPYGYYIINTIQEAKEYMQQLRNRLIEDALRRRDFKRAVAKSFDGAGQTKMF